MKIGIRSRELLNELEFSGAVLANCVGDLGRKYGNMVALPELVTGSSQRLCQHDHWGNVGSAVFLNLLSQSKFYFLNEQESSGALLANRISRRLG